MAVIMRIWKNAQIRENMTEVKPAQQIVWRNKDCSGRNRSKRKSVWEVNSEKSRKKRIDEIHNETERDTIRGKDRLGP
ncbi:Hypothetical protein CINCED_3A008292 [Cinara cedri]|uniref:Uncharacterized protein n=1 Tax=Cinara cedri TaxID=506608 RepID=A0A5E4MKQ6_9HEMI|nr:Hypothetical protein CINCED_3A008292 [Cinara cedri]